MYSSDKVSFCSVISYRHDSEMCIDYSYLTLEVSLFFVVTLLEYIKLKDCNPVFMVTKFI